MKKTVLGILLCLMLFMLCSCSSGNQAESVPATQEESVSKFEQVLLKKGSLIVKEFIDCGYFEKDEYIDYRSTSEMYGFTDALKLQAASLRDVETGKKVYALRVVTGYYASKYSYGEAVGVMDADEIDGAIQTLKYIKEHISEMKDYSEVIYNASSGMEVGAYHSSDEEKIYVKVNANATKFYDISKIDNLISSFENVKSKLEDAQTADSSTTKPE